MKVEIIASAEDQDCGINHYTESLESELDIPHSRTGIKSYSIDLLHYTEKTMAVIRGDSDIIHLQHEYGMFGPGSICSWPVIFLLMVADFFTDKKIVVTMHNVWDSQTFDPPFKKLKDIYICINNNLILTAADYVFVLSESSERKLVSKYGLKNYTRLSHGVQNDICELTKQQARQTLGWEEEAEIVILPGYIRRHKGYDVFLSVAEKDEDREYIIAGGVRNEKFEDYAENLKLSAPENIRVTGILDDSEFKAIFAAADLCYLPYVDASGQSGTANWALAHEVPVFGSDISYFRELEQETDGVNLVNSSAEEVAAKIAQFFADEENRARMSKAAAEYANQNSIESVADKHIQVYKSVRNPSLAKRKTA